MTAFNIKCECCSGNLLSGRPWEVAKIFANIVIPLRGPHRAIRSDRSLFEKFKVQNEKKFAPSVVPLIKFDETIIIMERLYGICATCNSCLYVVLFLIERIQWNKVISIFWNDFYNFWKIIFILVRISYNFL